MRLEAEGRVPCMSDLGGSLLCLGLLTGVLVLLEVGFRIGRRYRLAKGGEAASIFDGAIFALLGLLLGFAFAGAVDRLNLRRDLIVAEANAISTAYLRIDMLDAADQPAIRDAFQGYIAARLAIYRELDAGRDATPSFAAAEALQGQIWQASVAAVSRPERQFTAEIVLPAINEMIDLTTERKVALSTHIPLLVMFLLVGVSLFSALLAGVATARHGERQPVHAAVFAIAIGLTFYTIVDLDNPRTGLIKLEAADRVLQDLQGAL